MQKEKGEVIINEGIKNRAIREVSCTRVATQKREGVTVYFA